MDIVKKGDGSSGLKTGRSWRDIVKVLVDNRCLDLREGEIVTEIEINMEYGLTFKIEQEANK